MSDGRFVGRWYEWPCPRCHSVMQSATPPSREESHCAGCKLTLSMTVATTTLADLIADRDRWQQRALAAEKRNGDLLDELHVSKAGAA